MRKTLDLTPRPTGAKKSRRFLAAGLCAGLAAAALFAGTARVAGAEEGASNLSQEDLAKMLAAEQETIKKTAEKMLKERKDEERKKMAKGKKDGVEYDKRGNAIGINGPLNYDGFENAAIQPFGASANSSSVIGSATAKLNIGFILPNIQRYYQCATSANPWPAYSLYTIAASSASGNSCPSGKYKTLTLEAYKIIENYLVYMQSGFYNSGVKGQAYTDQRIVRVRFQSNYFYYNNVLVDLDSEADNGLLIRGLGLYPNEMYSWMENNAIDAAVLLRGMRSTFSNICGTARVGGVNYNVSPPAPIAFDTDQAKWNPFAVVASYAFAGSTGANGCSSSKVFAHELGHIMGLLHDDLSPSNGSYHWPNAKGYFSGLVTYSDGSKQGLYGDIMSYAYYGGQYYSTNNGNTNCSNFSYPNGCGDANHDATTALKGKVGVTDSGLLALSKRR